MKRNTIIVLAAALMITACSSGSGTAQNAAPAAQSTAETTSEAGAKETTKTKETGQAGIQVDQNLLTVDIDISADYAEQMGLSEDDTNDGMFNKIVKKDDGSFTITMTKAKHKELMDEMKQNIADGLQEIIDDDDYSFTEVIPNADYTSFEVRSSNSELSLYDSLTTIIFYMYGGLYNAFNGTPADNIHVDFKDPDGNIISSADSRNMGQGDAAATGGSGAEEPAAVDDTSEMTELTPSEVVTIDDNCDFALDYAKFSSDVRPPKPGDWYSHYEADNGKTFADICISYKNLANADVMADEVINGKLIYKDYYEYAGFSTIEKDNRSDFTYSNITSIPPLTTEYLHYLIEIPQEVESSEGSAVVVLYVGGNDYKVTMKTGTDNTIESQAAGKTSGELVDKERIVTKNADFYVDFCNITKDVMPPNPADYYSHYEADAGKAFVDICFAYKNLRQKAVSADKVMSAKLKYADKYDYTGYSTIEDKNRGDFTYTSITGIDPLTTEYVHYLFEVPEEVREGEEPIVITVNADGNEYSYKVR